MRKKKMLGKLTAGMLAVIMVFCSAISVGAADDSTYDLASLPEWSVSDGGAAVLAQNPTDANDDVAKISANSTATIGFTNEYTGNYLFCAKVYADNAAINIGLKNGTETVCTVPITVGESGIAANNWHTVKVLVSSNGKVYRTYIDDVYNSTGSITVSDVKVNSMSFGANAELYVNDVEVYKYSSPSSAEYLKPIYESNLTGEAGADIVNIDGWAYNTEKNKGVTYKLAVDFDDNSGKKIIKASSDASDKSNYSALSKTISSNVNTVISAKFYIPSKVGETDNSTAEIGFTVGTNSNSISLGGIFKHPSNDYWIIQYKAGSDTYTGNGFETDKWNDVKAVIDFELQSYDVYLNGVKVNNTPCKLTDGTKEGVVSEIKSLVLAINRKKAGTAYVKDVAVNAVNTVKTPAEDGAVTSIYNENFENKAADYDLTSDATYKKFTLNPANANESTLTVKKPNNGNSTNVAQYFDPNYKTPTSTTIKRYNDDGTEDKSAKSLADNDKKEESFSYSFSDDAKNKIAENGNITLKFKYYNAKNVVTVKGETETPSDILYIGFDGDASNDPNNCRIANNKNDTFIEINNQNFKVYDGSGNSVLQITRAKVQAWQNVEFTIEKKTDGKCYGTVKLPDDNYTSPEKELKGFYAYDAFVMRIERSYGGKFYLDDIEITTTGAGKAEVLYTDVELKSLADAVLEQVYTNPVGTGDIKAVKEAAEEFELTLPIDITNGIALDSFGMNGTAITWESSEPDVISNMGVVHPVVGQSKTVTLTATISKGIASEKKLFTVTVPAVSAYDIKGIQVTGNDGIVDSLLVAGKKISAVNLKKYAASGDTVTVICALYKANKSELVKAVVENVNTSGISQYTQSTINLTTALEIPNDATSESGYQASVYVFNNMSDIKPLAAAKNYGVQSDNPTIFILSDSTACVYDQDKYAPRTGWGQKFEGLLNDKVTLNNIAVSGMSTRSFFFADDASGDQGRFNTFNNAVKEGDIVLVQFGHNDEDASKTEKRTINKTADGNVDTTKSNSYEAYLQMIVDAAQNKNASVVFVTSPTTLSYAPSAAPALMKKFAAEKGLPVIDLNAATIELFGKLTSKNLTPKYYMMYWTEDTKEDFITKHGALGTEYADKTSYTDGTHYNAEGADMIANLLVGCTDKSNILSRYFKTGAGKSVDDIISAYPAQTN